MTTFQIGDVVRLHNGKRQIGIVHSFVTSKKGDEFVIVEDADGLYTFYREKLATFHLGPWSETAEEVAHKVYRVEAGSEGSIANAIVAERKIAADLYVRGQADYRTRLLTHCKSIDLYDTFVSVIDALILELLP